ncbi:hypothetical protein ABMA70_00995 [Halobacteriovorax sp. XZX-3]|uniref:hypothetical protein n=1 Tax=unclassified Halobacteriovorax TaxID=2639665 RepID=UPI000CD00861|nr:hypothetical protein [Halobacteriovorax sp. DA5]POB14343.1 hypothetical protein C0Z22_04425 [Halobacteriovorax sp. DA5]
MSESKKTDKSDGILGDTIKKVVSIGIGAAFMTEESVKKVLDDLPLPKDIVSGLMTNAKKTKEDFVISVREELRSYLKNVDPKTIVESILEDYEVTVSFKKKEKKSEK